LTHRIPLLAAACLAATAIAPASAARADACYADWTEALAIINREKLVTMEQLSPITRAQEAGDILKSTLCEEQGRYVYRLVVRDRRGRLKNLVVDARRPFGR
jgi:uncharacterized membrane protein YkoI